MDLEEIKCIVNADSLSNEVKKSFIINVLAADENIIPLIMKILNEERKYKEELITDMNVLLSKVHLGLDNSEINQNNFMQKEIIAFYKKHNQHIRHCFKNLKF